jgi:hypothetical protein
MQILDSLCRMPRGTAHRIGALSLGLMLSVAALAPATTTSLAAPKAGCATPPAGQTQLQCVITFGDNEITRRDTALDTLSGKVTNQANAGHITSAQATDLQNDVSTNKSGLATLKATLDAASTVQDARKDVALIYTQFRIFAVVLPRDYHRLWLDMLITVDQKLRAAQTKIDAAIQATSNDADKDGDKAAIAAAYQDFKNQIAAAEGQIDGAQGLLPTLTPAQFDDPTSSYKKDYTDYVNDIRTAHQDLVAGANDLRKIARLLKDLSGTHGSSTAPTATPSA